MPIAFACPSCSARFEVDDSLGGKKCKCTRCGSQFIVPAAAASAVAKKPVPPPPANDEDDRPRKRSRVADEDNDRPRAKSRKDDDEDEDRPRSKRRKDDDEDEEDRPRSKRRKDEDDDEGDRPRAKRSKDDDEEEEDRPRRRYQDDEEEDEDDRPKGRRSRKRGSRKVLFLVIGAAAFVCVLLAVGLVWYFWSGGLPSEAKYLPENSQLIVSVKVEDLLNSKVYKQLKDEFPDLQKELDLDKIQDEYGLPVKNISTLLIGGSQTEHVAAVRTLKSVKAGDILGNMKHSDFKDEKVGKYTLYTQGGNAFCVAESNIVLYGDPETLRKVLKRDKAPEFSSGLTAAIKEADFSKTVAVAANFKALMRKEDRGAGRPPGLGIAGALGADGADEIFKDADGFAMWVNVKSDLSWKMSMIFKDSKSAADAKKMFEGLAVILKKAKSAPPVVTETLESVEYKQSGNRVESSGSMETSKLIKVIKAFNNNNNNNNNMHR